MNHKSLACAFLVLILSTSSFCHTSNPDRKVQSLFDRTFFIGKVVTKGLVCLYSGLLCAKYASRAANRYIGNGHLGHIDLKRIVHQARGPVKRLAIISGLALVTYEVWNSFWDDLNKGPRRKA